MLAFCDQDFYKFTMAQCVFHRFAKAEAEYQFVCRSKIDLSSYEDAINESIDIICATRISNAEITFLRNSSISKFFRKDFVDFLDGLTLQRKYVNVYQADGQLQIKITGPWLSTIWFEIPILAAISEIYCREQASKKKFSTKPSPSKHLQRCIDESLLKSKYSQPIKFSDFGTRRRFSAQYHSEVIQFLKNMYPDNFSGTSNVHFANHFQIPAIGTMAHEFIQAGQGLDIPLHESQHYMLDTWLKEYDGELGIALTDTIGMDTFLRDFDMTLARKYAGCRHDSGNPFVWAEKLITHYKKLGIDPLSKTVVFSDALTFPLISELHKCFSQRINVAFGIGTNLTNNVGVNPLSMVIKLSKINGNPVAKISDNPEKVVCNKPEFLKQLKKAYNINH